MLKTSAAVCGSSIVGEYLVSDGGLPARAARKRLSPILRVSKTLLAWKVRMIPSRAIDAGSRWAAGEPLIRISPAVGRRSPVIALTSVDLPAPFGPIIQRS